MLQQADFDLLFKSDSYSGAIDNATINQVDPDRLPISDLYDGAEAETKPIDTSTAHRYTGGPICRPSLSSSIKPNVQTTRNNDHSDSDGGILTPDTSDTSSPTINHRRPSDRFVQSSNLKELELELLYLKGLIKERDQTISGMAEESAFNEARYTKLRLRSEEQSRQIQDTIIQSLVSSQDLTVENLTLKKENGTLHEDLHGLNDLLDEKDSEIKGLGLKDCLAFERYADMYHEIGDLDAELSRIRSELSTIRATHELALQDRDMWRSEAEHYRALTSRAYKRCDDSVIESGRMPELSRGSSPASGSVIGSPAPSVGEDGYGYICARDPCNSESSDIEAWAENERAWEEKSKALKIAAERD